MKSKNSFVYIAATLVFMVLCGRAFAQTGRQVGSFTVALPLVVAPGTGGNPNPTPVPPAGNTPATLAGTWFSGQLLNQQFYDPTTKEWNDAGGLGHTYVFNSDGTYLLASALELNSGPFCKSNVWKYERGIVAADDSTLHLTPSLSRTRTVVRCGSSSDTEVEGDHATYDLPWQVGLDEKGHTLLTLTEAHGVTTYFKDGIAPQMLGTWRRGAVQSDGFYNPATGEFAYPTGEGEWMRFKADGTFERGEVDFQYISDECNYAVVTYQTGTFRGSGSLITLQGTGGLRTKANLCDLNDQTDEQLGTVTPQRWTWSLADNGNTLGMIRIEIFTQYSYEREP